jgi:hypothetical protein
MPPLLKTYFNPSHRSFLQTLFTATFLGSVLIVAFPCPVRPETGGFHKVANQAESRKEEGGISSETARVAKDKVDVVVMMNERGRGKGKLRFLEED